MPPASRQILLAKYAHSIALSTPMRRTLMSTTRAARRALLCSIILSAATASAAQHSSLLTNAALPQSLAASDFHEVALQGLGDRANSWAWSMEWFHNKLYVGANRNYDCLAIAAQFLSLPTYL